MMGRKRALDMMGTDEFLEKGFLTDSESETSSSHSMDVNSPKRKANVKEKPLKKKLKTADKKVKVQKVKEPLANGKKGKLVSSAKEANPVTSKQSAGKKHKEALEKLKDKDPEFFKFLQNEDSGLLNFDPAGSGSDEDDTDLTETDEDASSTDSESRKNPKRKVAKYTKSAKLKKKAKKDVDDIDFSESEASSGDEDNHSAPGKLEVASGSDTDDEEDMDEDSDDEDDDDGVTGDSSQVRTQRLVTLKMVQQWTTQLRSSDDWKPALTATTHALKAAVRQAGSDDIKDDVYRVDGSTVFNAIVRLCLVEVLPLLKRLLSLTTPEEGKEAPIPSTRPRWKKVSSFVKSYLGDLLKLMSQLAEPSVLNVVLKHVHQMVPFYSCFPGIARSALKTLITVWSSGEETSRVLAFLCLNKLALLRRENMLEFTLKQMYMAYVRNCKFTSPTTLPVINFMQRSLVEMFAIDLEITYQYAFVYIRQMAIHLRNAITIKKADMCQAVYNWQFVHSLHLWARLLSQLYPCETLEPLIYPLTQVIIGTIKLIPTARYYPLRFHCVRALNILSEATKTYIPVLPFLTELFAITDFRKKHKRISFKPHNYAVMLKFSKAQLEEKAFKDGLVDQLYEQLMEHFRIYAHTIGFPELALPALVEMKKFVKECKVANYTRQVKQVVDKVEETSKVISQRRRTANLSLSDVKSIEAWEKKSLEQSTPLGKFYANWRKLRDRELQHEEAGKDRISYDALPTIDRKSRDSRKATDAERKEFSGLFESDDESGSSDDDADRFLLREERKVKKESKSNGAEGESDSEEYDDFDDDELERLAGSGGDDDNDDDDDDDNDDDEDDNEDEEAEAVVEPEDVDDAGDIVKDFTFSSDEED